METVTVNISLPKQLADQIDQEVARGQYISRSEFFRTLVRFYTTLTKKRTVPIEFFEFKKRPRKEIKEGLLATGKYSKKFVEEIVAGLKRESLYADS